MGLIKAGLGALGGVLADQWKEYFYCEAIPSDILGVKGLKRVSGRSSNTKGEDNIISNGSVIAVADGQCMLIVEQGKVVDVCAEPGEFVYNNETEPSLFTGSLKESIIGTFKNIGKRFTFGGGAGNDQRVYYFNTKEIVGNKFGTPSPVPFRVVDQRAGIDIDIGIKCFGEYTFTLEDPLLFYTNVCGNFEDEYSRRELESQMRTELLTALQPAFATISEMGIRYSQLVGKTNELRTAVSDQLTAPWLLKRGIQIGTIGISSLTADEEDEKMIKELQRNAAFMDPTRAAAQLVGAQAQAMQDAANNEGGAVTGFMGMGMAQGAGGANAANLYAMGAQQPQQAATAAPTAPTPAPAAGGWTCECGTQNTGKFCQNCGKPQPAPAASWKCECGAENTGKFCANCGKPKPTADGWTCECGAINKGKFCSNCGKPKPAGVQQYKCDKCGWEPEKGVKPPKFCPNCGDPFDDGDVI